MYEMLQSAQGGRRLRELVVFGLNPESDCNWVGKKLCFYKLSSVSETLDSSEANNCSDISLIFCDISWAETAAWDEDE